MTGSILQLAVLLAAGGFVEVTTFPAPDPAARFFVAPVEPGGRPALLSLAGHTLTVHYEANPDDSRAFVLPADTTAVDVFDLDGDGATELIAVAGTRVLRHQLARDAPAEPDRVLFERETLFLRSAPTPFLHVIGVIWQGQRLLGLPTAERFELRDARGALVEEWPAGANAPHHAAYGQPFTRSAVDPPVIGPPGALEFQVRRQVAVLPDLPRELPMREPRAPYVRADSPIVEEGRDATYWPAFPLYRDRAGTEVPEELRRAEVHYARAAPHALDTFVSLRTPGRGGGEARFRIEPPRRYPGTLLSAQADGPDFNRNGLVDLVLWQLPARPPTVEQIAKALTRGRWPIRITVHPFEIRRRRYAPAPSAYLDLELPAAWFIEQPGAGPLRHVVLQDFDGDGHTDFACATHPDTYAIWRYTEDGFPGTPSWRMQFDEPLTGVAFREHVKREHGGRGLALRTPGHLHLLSPRP